MTNAPSGTNIPEHTFLLGGDLPVRRIGLGTMRLTDATGDGTQAGAQIWRAPADPTDAIELLRRAVDLGVQLIDTADAYALGESEELIAQALHPYADDLVIATKVGNLRPTPTEWVPLGHPGYLKQQVELSLRCLRVERIDLLQLHRHDPVVDRTATAGIAFLPFFPLAVGDLAREGSAVETIARELGATASQIALAWLLHRAPNMLPIPGTTSLAHLEQNLDASSVVLSEAQLQRISV